MLMGDRAAALSLAQRVLDRLDAKPEPLDVWDQATQGEAQLLLGDVASAGRSYAAACAQAGTDAGSVAAMRRQIQLLGRVLPDARILFDELPAASVLAFTGQAVDGADRAAHASAGRARIGACGRPCTTS